MFYTRRDFLKVTVGAPILLSLKSMASNPFVRTASAVVPQREEYNRVLVVLQLSGGNDGLIEDLLASQIVPALPG